MIEVPSTRYARTSDGVHIGYQVLGEGPPDLVIAGTWFTNVDTQWDLPGQAHLLRQCARFSRVVTFDKRGVGVSDPVPLAALPTLEEWMDDLRAVLDEIGSERAALYGVMGGGLGCLLFAATYPDRTTGLILHDGYARWTEASDYPMGVRQHHIPRFIEESVHDFPNADGRWEPSDPKLKAVYARALRSAVSPGMLEAIARTTTSVDARQILDSITVPTLVISGLRALAGPTRFLRDHILGARLVELSPFDSLDPLAAEHLVDVLAEFVTGAKPPLHTDRVLATVLFTDIVGSTEHAARLGDRKWTRILDQHDVISVRELERFRGRKVNPTGDGLLATFDGPARAVHCAQALHESMRPLGIEIRAGLHVGEIELRGEDIGGIAVHIGQRVSALAEPGEVLVSSTVKDLVAGSGIEFEDRGEHGLKGVPGSWRLFSVRG